MELTHKSILDLVSSHRRLDGTKDYAYKFTPKVRYSLAKNLRLLENRADDIAKARMSLAKELLPDPIPAQDTPEFKAADNEFQARFSEFLNLSEEIPNIMRFHLSELNLDINQIPVTVLSALSPLILDEDAPETPKA